MTPAAINLTIYQGATFRRSFTWKTGNPATAVDLTGYTARMMIRRKITDETPILTLTTENGGIDVTDAEAGEFDLVIDAATTAAIEIRAGVYDLEWVVGDVVTRFMQGSVSVSPEVTR